MANKNDYIINVLAKGVGKTEKELKGLNASLGKMTKAVGVVSAAYFGATGLISGVMGAVDAFSRQEEAEKKLRFALGSNTQALLNQASALQKVTKFGDEAIIEQQTFLASLKFSEDQIKSIIPVALDLSEATGITLESAVRNTAKTFSGLAGELGELVPQLRGLTKEQMMAGDAVKVMGELFAGQAQAGAKTLSGQLEQLKNTLGDTAEAFGELLVPIILPLAKGLRLVAEGATEVIDAFKFKEELPVFVKMFSDAEIKAKEFASTLKDKTLSQLIELNNAIIDQGVIMQGQEGFDLMILKSEELNKEMNKRIENAIEEDNIITELDFRSKKRTFEKMQIQQMDFSQTKRLKELQIKMTREERAENAQTVSAMLGGIAKLTGASADGAKATARIMQAQAIADTYAGANRALATGVPPMSYVQAAVSVATGLANVIQISKSIGELSKFEQGGLVGGRRHSQGGTMIEAESGEFVMSRDAVSRIGVNNLEAMNSGGSGMTINISAPLVDDTVVDSIIPKIKEAVRRGESLT
tara:strand:- start:177 stop:1763 length:1587 start_codon:yes stop_codon:yes gene_type:complete